MEKAKLTRNLFDCEVIIITSVQIYRALHTKIVGNVTKRWAKVTYVLYTGLQVF